MTPPALNRRTPRYLLPSRTKDIIIHYMVNPETIAQFLKRLLIGACALAMVALIAFQVNWMKHSSRLIEEQFNNRVNMALCSAVESLAADQNSSASFRACCAEVNTQPGCMQSVDELPTATGMNQTLAQSLNFYQISLPYEAVIAPKDTLNVEQGEIPPFSCALTPILQDDTHMLQLQFKGKAGYILDKMGWMVGASIVILLFISGIFTLASYYLLRQKKMSDLNRDFFASDAGKAPSDSMWPSTTEEIASRSASMPSKAAITLRTRNAAQMLTTAITTSSSVVIEPTITPAIATPRGRRVMAMALTARPIGPRKIARNRPGRASGLSS